MLLLSTVLSTPAPQPPGLGTIRTFAAMFAVLGLVMLLAWLVRRGTLRLPGSRTSVPVTVEAAVPLGERRSLVVVAVEGRRLLLGLTPVQVSLVTELGAAAPDGRFEAALERHAGDRRES